MALPKPELGLVLSYSYLWHREYETGAEEGRKNRPCVIVVATEIQADGTVTVEVAPITHSEPENQALALEIPPPIKRHLGLDDARSWIVLNETNEFVWPGFDLRPIPGRSGRFDYGYLPPRLFEALTAKMRTLWGMGRGRRSSR